MPKQRPVIESGIKPPEVKTSFPRFADGYVPGAAARGASSQLDQLAKGLSNFNRSVTPFLQDLRAAQIQKEQEEGRTAAQAGEELPEDATRHQRASFDTTMGSNAAVKAHSDALAEVSAMYKAEVSVSPEEWDQLYQSHLDAAIPEGASDEYRNAFYDQGSALALSERQNVARRYDISAATDEERAKQNILATGFSADLQNAEVDIRETIAEINLANEERIRLGANPRMVTSGTYDTLEAQILLNENIPIERRMEAIEALGDLQLKEGPARGSTLYAKRMVALKEAIEVQYEDSLNDKIKISDKETKLANEASLGLYLDRTRDGGEPTEAEWRQWKIDARGAGGPSSEAYVVQLQDAQKARVEKGKEFKVDREWAARFTLHVMDGTYDQKAAREQIQYGLVSGKLDTNAALALERQVDNMPQEGNTASRISEHRTYLKQYHMGADFGPGVTVKEQDQYEAAVRHYDEYLVQSDEYNDPNTSVGRKREIENEALDNTNAQFASLRSRTMVKREEIKVEQYPILAEETYGQLEEEIMALEESGLEWTGDDLSRELLGRIAEEGGAPLLGQTSEVLKRLLDTQYLRGEGLSAKADTAPANQNSRNQ